MKKDVLTLKKISKEKSGNRILNQFYMKIVSGEIINLIGLEGSGKHEIYSILFGEDQIDSGEIWFSGKVYHKRERLPVEQVNGIFFIGNHDLIIPDLTVAENIYIIEKINYFQLSVSRKKMEQQARKLFARFGVEIDPKKYAKKLDQYECCVLRLMRAYVKRAKLIVIDDILDDCSYEKISQLTELLNHFKEEGIAILWLNNYPDAITKIADKTIVICNGKTSRIFYQAEYDHQTILKCLTGKQNPGRSIYNPQVSNRLAFCAESVQSAYFLSLSFSCRAKEILGIYDLQNKFSQELYGVVTGKRAYKGRICIDGKAVKMDAEYQLVKNKVGVVDGNSYQSLLFPDMSLEENLEMAAYQKTVRFGCFINHRIQKYLDKRGKEICEDNKIRKDVRGASRRDAMQIVFHRWELVNPKVLLCFQPFLRLDAISRKQVEEILLDFRARGTGIIISSANIADLLSICDRIMVIEKREIKREIERSQFSEVF